LWQHADREHTIVALADAFTSRFHRSQSVAEPQPIALHEARCGEPIT
jgi:hypothetical protein